MVVENLCMGCMEEKNDNVCPSPKICGWIEGSPALSVDQLSPRTVLMNRYVLGRALGQGAFGITYVAWDLTDERKIAIKEYFPKNVAGRSTDRTTVAPYANVRQAAFHSGLRKFTDEARDLKRMGNRSGLVTVLKAFETNGTCYMAMDFLIGETLAKHIEEKPEGRLLFREVLGILIPPMEALIELHKNGLFHVDINPNHVCVSGSSGKLLDFGGAKRATRFSELTMQVWGLNGFFGIGAVRKPSSYTFSRSNGWNAFRSVLAPRQLELHAAPKDCLPPSSPLTEFVEVVFSRMATARSSPKTTIFRIVLGQGY